MSANRSLGRLPPRLAKAVAGGLALCVPLGWALPARAEAQESAFVDNVDDARWDRGDGGGESDRLPLWARLGPPAESFDRVIQRRRYVLLHELFLTGGGLPADPLYKAGTLSAGYTWHFNHYVGWEVLEGTLVFPTDTSLRRQLTLLVPTTIGAPIEKLLATRSQIDWFVASRLVIKPFYGKEALLSAGLVHLEVFVAAGPALVHTSGALSQTAHLLGLRDLAPSWGLGLDVALGLRLWLAKHLSLRAELGELVYFEPGPKQALHASGGLAVNFGGEGT